MTIARTGGLARHLSQKAFDGVRRDRKQTNYTPREYAVTIMIDAGINALKDLENEMPHDTEGYREKVAHALRVQVIRLADRYKLDVSGSPELAQP